MTKQEAYDYLFKTINSPLEKYHIIVKTGAIIDASIIDTLLKLKGEANYPAIKEREYLEEIAVKKEDVDRVDHGV